ncbi:MAG: hypothetical protein ACJ8GN_21915 [Longimicrobiaceae bacterium]
MKVYAGRSFIYPDGGIPHLWIVVTQPSGTPAEVAIVSITSYRHGKDDTVKLAPGDHPFIRKPSVVFYPDTRVMPVEAIVREVTNAQASFHDDCSEDLLERVRQGLLASPATPRRMKEYVRDRI